MNKVMLFILVLLTSPFFAQTTTTSTSDYCQVRSYVRSNYIAYVVFSNINHDSGLGKNGYSDFTTTKAKVYPGETYGIGIGIKWDNWTKNRVQTWIDWNQNSVFEESERVVNIMGAGLLSDRITIPINAKLGETRMRVRYTYDSLLGSCETNTHAISEVEDYTISIESLTKPRARFNASRYFVKSDKDLVVYEDISKNNATSWYWEFEGGIPATSTEESPVVQYTRSGDFAVLLIVENEHGIDEIVIEDYMKVEIYTDYCSAKSQRPVGQYITSVAFADVKNTSTYNSIGYQEYNLSSATVEKGLYTASSEASLGSIKTNAVWEDTKVGYWIDWNQDGDFYDVGETNLIDGVNSAGVWPLSFVVPQDALLGETTMRIRTVFGSSINSCSDVWIGETEDYIINIVDSNAKNASFYDSTIIEKKGSVFPNPSADGKFTFVFDELSKNPAFKVYNNTGVELHNFGYRTISENTVSLDLSALGSGIYMVKKIVDNTSKMVKLVIK